MNKKQPSCIYLREILLENTNCNLGIEYEFYATTPLGQRSKGETAVAIKKENTQETKYKNNHPGGSSGSLPDRKEKEDSMLYTIIPNRPGDRGRHKISPGATPSAYDPAGRF